MCSLCAPGQARRSSFVGRPWSWGCEAEGTPRGPREPNSHPGHGTRPFLSKGNVTKPSRRGACACQVRGTDPTRRLQGWPVAAAGPARRRPAGPGASPPRVTGAGVRCGQATLLFGPRSVPWAVASCPVEAPLPGAGAGGRMGRDGWALLEAASLCGWQAAGHLGAHTDGSLCVSLTCGSWPAGTVGAVQLTGLRLGGRRWAGSGEGGRGCARAPGVPLRPHLPLCSLFCTCQAHAAKNTGRMEAPLGPCLSPIEDFGPSRDLQGLGSVRSFTRLLPPWAPP